MTKQVESTSGRTVALEAAAWRTRIRLEEMFTQTVRLEIECKAGVLRQALLQQERRALTEETAYLRRVVAHLSEQIEDLQTSLGSARNKVVVLQKQLCMRFAEQDTIKKERDGLSAMLGQAIFGLLGLRAGKRPSRRVLTAGTKALNRIGLVDPDWYKARYPDVASSGMDPVLHYLCFGSLEGRDPRNPGGR